MVDPRFHIDLSGGMHDDYHIGRGVRSGQNNFGTVMPRLIVVPIPIIPLDRNIPFARISGDNNNNDLGVRYVLLQTGLV